MVGPGEALEFKATQILNEGIAIGREEGRHMLVSLVKEGIITEKQAADKANVTVNEFKEKYLLPTYE